MQRLRIIAIQLLLALFLTLLPMWALADQASTDTFCSATSSGRHSWSEWTTTRQATCTQTGARERICGRCGYTQTETVKKAGHSWGKWKTTVEATCTEPGEQTRKCSVCGRRETRQIDRLPHAWGEWTVVTAATDHSAGARSHVCQVCAAQATENYDPEGTLRRGDRSDAVRELQEGLICYGALTGRADGRFGPATEKAIMAVQQAEGLTADGVAWPQTLARLGHRFGEWQVLSEKTDFSAGLRRRICGRCGIAEEEEDWPEPTYRRGDKGEGVKALQERLNAAGYDCGRADGAFGSRTEAAVKAIEAAHGIEPDGIAWPGVQKWLTVGEVPEADSGLVLTILPSALAVTGYKVNQEVSFDWTIANHRAKDITLEAIYMDWGDDGMIGVYAEPVVLRANGANSASGTWTTPLDAEWLRDGRFHMHFFGRGVEDGETRDETYIVSNETTYDLSTAPLDRDSASETLNKLRNITINLTDLPLPLTILTQPVGGEMDPDSAETMLLSVEVIGGKAPYSYNWYRQFTFQDHDGTSMTIGHWRGDDSPELPVNEPGRYYCKIRDQETMVKTEIVEVTSRLFIAQQPQNASLSGVDSVTLNCVAAGGEPFDGVASYIYTWYDAAGKEVEFSDVGLFEATEPGEYYCTVMDNRNTVVTSKTCTVYDAEPLRCVSFTYPTQVEVAEDVEVFGRFTGGVPPYAAQWTLDGEEVPMSNVLDGGSYVEYQALANAFGAYICTVTDSIGNTVQAEARVEYAQLGIEQQPVGGMLSKDGETPVEIFVVMASGVEPFTYTLWHDGEQTQSGEAAGFACDFQVYEPGEYFIHIEDVDGRWADTDAVLVQDYEFHIDALTVEGELSGPEATVTLNAQVVGGDQPITYRWVREDGYDGGLSDTMEPSRDIGLPGKYYCKAEDASGSIAISPRVEVDYTSETPIILQQPQSVLLNDAKGGEYSAELSCRAMSASPTTPYYNSISYTWERKGEGGWLYNREQGSTIHVTELGTYRCICLDTYSGKKTISREVTVDVRMTALGDIECYDYEYSYLEGGYQSRYAAKVRFAFTGGVPPFTVREYINEVPGGEGEFSLRNSKTITDRVYTMSMPLKAAVVEQVNDREVLWQTYPLFYFVVTDALGQTLESNIADCQAFKNQ